MNSGFEIRTTTEADVPVILSLIRELAEYERAPDAVVATEAGLRDVLFGPNRSAEVLLALENGEAVGFAVYFYNFSTWLGRPGLYLEDLFVRPAVRGKGFGRALLERLAQIAKERGCGRMEWAVLDWNDPAIQFYRKLGAEPMNEWTVFRLTKEGIAKLAQEIPAPDHDLALDLSGRSFHERIMSTITSMSRKRELNLSRRRGRERFPFPFTLTGTAKKRAPRSGTAPSPHMCSTMGMPAPSKPECTGRVPSSVESILNESMPTRVTPASTREFANSPVR